MEEVNEGDGEGRGSEDKNDPMDVDGEEEIDQDFDNPDIDFHFYGAHTPAQDPNPTPSQSSSSSQPSSNSLQFRRAKGADDLNEDTSKYVTEYLNLNEDATGIYGNVDTVVPLPSSIRAICPQSKKAIV